MYQLHRPDPKVPLVESVEMLAQLQQEGKIRHIGLSNVTIEQIEAAHRLVDIASVQNRLNLAERNGEDVLDYCTQHGIAFIPYGSLGANPLKRGAPLAKEEGTLAEIASYRGAKPSQIALAWMLHRAPNIVVIPGTTTLTHLKKMLLLPQLCLHKKK